MQNLIAEYEAIIDILKSQLSDKDANIKAIKDEYSAIIDVIQTSNQDKVDSLSDKIDEYKKALEVYSLSLQSSNTKINNLTNELTEANATVKSLKSELKMVYESFNNRVTELTTVNESMINDIELYSTEVNTSKDNYSILLEEHKELEAKYLELLNKVEEDKFELQESSIYEGEANITLVNVITESKEDSKLVDTLTLSLLNKINKK
jgi:chromosome segregation ATPase